MTDFLRQKISSKSASVGQNPSKSNLVQIDTREFLIDGRFFNLGSEWLRRQSAMAHEHGRKIFQPNPHGFYFRRDQPLL